MTSLSLAFDVLARDQGAVQTLDKVADSMSRAARAGSFFGSVAGTLVGKGLAAIGSGALTALHGLTHLTEAGFGELFAFQKGFSQLQAGIASTGGVAGVGADQLEKLAGAIQAYSGQTDDSIVASEQLLLTFTNIRNQVGANNDIFDQATKATADLAARMGGDASASAIQLGKALNDPVAGITALTRIGVSFSDSQKKQIAGFVQSGKVMQAQRVILSELNKEFGGSARAFGNTLPGEIAKSKRAFEDFSQGVAAALAPTIAKYLPKLTQGLQNAGPKLQDFVTRVAPAIARGLQAAFNFVRGFITKTVDIFRPLIANLRDAFERLAAGLGTIFDKPKHAAESLGAAFAVVGGQSAALMVRGLTFVLNAATKVVPVFLQMAANIAQAGSTFIGFVRTMLEALPPLLGAAASVADALGFHGTADKLKSAKSAIADFGRDAQANLDAFAQSALNAAAAFDDAVNRVLKSQDDARRTSRDLDSDNPNVAARAQAAASAAVSKSTTSGGPRKAGQDYSVSVAKGLDDGKKTIVAAAQRAVDAASKVFEAAKSHLQALVADSLSLRQSVTSALQNGSSLADIFSGPDLNANGAFGSQRNFGRVKDFLQRRVAMLRKFIIELRALMAKGLDPSLVAQIAQAGPDAGRRIAEAILSGGSGAVGQVNGLERQIASLANSTGKSVADQHYAQQIQVARHQTEVLGHKLDVANSHLAQIQNAGSAAKPAAASLRANAALAGV